ncbi:ABC transporter substrate-binding protein [Streptomyces sp. NPDC006879]|uniref:ABC transporter substrate-binding protein n=1 Tax=Streptomyces sp. NPDC006879 TaxID=3364767 RepID=UPI0036856DBC
MTGWRRMFPHRPDRYTHPRIPTGTGARSAPVRTAVCAVVGASFIAGCGVLPGDPGGSREPLTVMTWAPVGTKATNMAGMPAMAQAYARWVNANGGLAGRDLNVLTCNEHNTPTGAADCARKAVAAGAVAVIGSYSQHGRAFMAPLETAGIPYIGGYGVSSEEFKSALSYPVNGGQPALLAGNGRQLARDCERVALVRPDTLPGDSMSALLNAGLTGGKNKAAVDIVAAEDASDYSEPAREALGAAGADPALPARIGTAAAREKAAKGCVTAVLGERTETFFDSFRRMESKDQKVRISSVLGSVSQDLINSTGGKNGPFEGAYVTGWYPVSSDPLWDRMKGVIRDHAFGDDRIDPADTGVQTTWIAYSVFSEITKRLADGEISARKVARALDRAEGVATGGLTPPLSWRYEDMRAVTGFPRIVNGQVTFQLVREGRLVALADGGDSGSMDMTQTLENAPGPI